MDEVKKLLSAHPDAVLFFAFWIFPVVYHLVVVKLLKAAPGTFWGRVDEILRAVGADPTILEKREKDVDDAVKELAEDLLDKGQK